MPLQFDTQDPEVDAHMAAIRSVHGEAAAEGRPTSTLQFDEPRLKFDSPAPAKSKPKAKPSLLERAKEYVRPHLTMEEALDPKLGATALTFGLAGGAMGGLPGAAMGVAGTYLGAEAQKREYEKFKDLGYSDEAAQRASGLSSTVLGLGTGLIPTRLSTPSTSYPRPPVETYAEINPRAEGGKPIAGMSSDELLRASRSLTSTPQVQSGLSGGRVGLPTTEGGIPLLQGPEKPMISTKVPGANPIRVPEPLGAGASAPMKSISHAPEGAVQSSLPTVPDIAGRPLGITNIQQGPTGNLPWQRGVSGSTPSGFEPGSLPPEPMGTVNLRGGKPYEPLAITPRERPKVTKGFKDETRLPKVIGPQTKLTPAQEATFELEWTARRDAGFKELVATQEAEPKSISPTSVGSDPYRHLVSPGMKDVLTMPPAKGAQGAGTVFSELESTGVIGKDISFLGRVFVKNEAETMAYNDIVGLDAIMERHLGKAPAWKRNVPWSLPDSAQFYNISKAQQRQLVNYLATASGDYGTPLVPKDLRIKALADEIINFNNTHSSAHPGVRQAVVRNADGSKTPVGQPKAYYPFSPVDPELQQGLQGRAFELAYKQRLKVEPGLTRPDFRARLKTQLEPYNYPRYAGLESQRLIDPTDGGTREPFDVLKEIGYDVDPLRAFGMRYTGLYTRGQEILAQKPMMELLHRLENESGDTSWVRAVGENILGTDREYPDKMFGDLVSKSNNIVNTLLLQRSAIPQWNQLVYTFARYGDKGFIKSLMHLPEPLQKEVMERSAANYATYLQMLTPNADMVGQILQRELQINGMTRSDSIMRLFAARASDNNLMSFARAYGATPNHPTYVSRLREARFSPAQIADIQKRGLTLEDRIQAAKIGADETQGRPGQLGIPRWATKLSENFLGRSLLNLRRFMLANMTEVRRLTTEAHMNGVPLSKIIGRVVRLNAGAIGLGELTNDLTYSVLHFDDPMQDARTPKWMRESMGETAGRIVHDWAGGVSSFQGALVMAVIQGTDDAVANLLTPVNIAKFWDLYQEARKAVEKGDTEALARFLMKYSIGTEGPMGPKPDRSGSGMNLPRMPKTGLGGE